jgi:hypothetical protein
MDGNLVKPNGQPSTYVGAFRSNPQLIIEKLEEAGGNLAAMFDDMHLDSRACDRINTEINLLLDHPDNQGLLQRFEQLLTAYARGKDFLAKSRAINQITDYVLPHDTRPGELAVFGKFWFQYMKGKSVGETETSLEVQEITDAIQTMIAEIKKK